MAMQIRNRDGIIYTVTGRIDISARACVRYIRAFYAPTVLAASRASLSLRNDISPEADRMESWRSLGDAFGKIRLYFKVSSRHLQLQQSDIVNDKNPSAISVTLYFTQYWFLSLNLLLRSAREKKRIIIKRLKRKRRYNFSLFMASASRLVSSVQRK